MKKALCGTIGWGAAAALFACLFGGCARQHYVTIQPDSITLFYRDSSAREVLFASSIDHFTLHPAMKAGNSLWRVTIPKHDEFTYFYYVDKVPKIPGCELSVVDDFGARNCLFTHRM